MVVRRPRWCGSYALQMLFEDTGGLLAKLSNSGGSNNIRNGAMHSWRGLLFIAGLAIIFLITWFVYLVYFALKLHKMRRGVKDKLWLPAKASGQMWTKLKLPKGVTEPQRGVEIKNEGYSKAGSKLNCALVNPAQRPLCRSLTLDGGAVLNVVHRLETLLSKLVTEQGGDKLKLTKKQWMEKNDVTKARVAVDGLTKNHYIKVGDDYFGPRSWGRRSSELDAKQAPAKAAKGASQRKRLKLPPSAAREERRMHNQLGFLARRFNLKRASYWQLVIWLRVVRPPPRTRSSDPLSHLECLHGCYRYPRHPPMPPL